MVKYWVSPNGNIKVVSTVYGSRLRQLRRGLWKRPSIAAADKAASNEICDDAYCSHINGLAATMREETCLFCTRDVDFFFRILCTWMTKKYNNICQRKKRSFDPIIKYLLWSPKVFPIQGFVYYNIITIYLNELT